MQYVGRDPDADTSVIPKGYTDTRYGQVKVDTAYVNSEAAAQAANLVTPAYVDTQDAQRAHKAAVDAADANYLPTSQRGTANGVAPTDASIYIPSANLPAGIQTERKPVFVVGDSSLFTSNQVLTTVGAKRYRAAALSITDPGFPYVPMFFAMVQGGSLNGTQSDPLLGTGNFGQISVLRDSDDLKYSWCLAGSQKTPDFSLCIPFADSTINPGTRPPLTGNQTFSLWLGLFGGTTYTFIPTGFNFFCMIFPGV